MYHVGYFLYESPARNDRNARRSASRLLRSDSLEFTEPLTLRLARAAGCGRSCDKFLVLVLSSEAVVLKSGSALPMNPLNHQDATGAGDPFSSHRANRIIVFTFVPAHRTWWRRAQTYFF